MSAAAVIASVAVVACSLHRSTRDVSGDAAKIIEYTDGLYRLDVSFDVATNERIDPVEFLEYIRAYRQRSKA
jgi:hypothetical protein